MEQNIVGRWPVGGGWIGEGGEDGMGRSGVKYLEEGREWRLTSLLYADDLVVCGEMEEDMRALVGRFAEVCMRRGLSQYR